MQRTFGTAVHVGNPPSLRTAGAVLLLAASAALLPDLARADGLEEIVVTARKREESILNIPVAVTAISSEQLDNFQLRTLEAIGSG